MELFGSASPKRKARPIEIAKKGDSAADIFLYDIIGDSWDGTTAKQFAKDLKALGDIQTLNIYINSDGGSVVDGTAIYNQLRRHRARKVVTVDGLAASIASVIAMVGDEIRMPKNSRMMIHDAWAAAIIMGTAADFRDTGNKIADILETSTRTILNTYVDRTGTSAEKIRKMMADETWLTAEEAVALGFADVLDEADIDIAALAKHDYSAFKNIPKSLAELVASKTSGEGQPSTEDTATDAAPAPHPIYMKAARIMQRHKQGQP